MWPFGKDTGDSKTISTIPFVHTVNSRARNVTIKIDRGGRVVVVSPPLIPTFFINQFVEKHTEWIEQRLRAIKQVHKNTDSVAIFGKEYTKKITYIPEKALGVFVTGNEILANTPEAAVNLKEWGKQQDLQLARFLKSTASTYITTRTAQLAQKMKIEYGSITLREQSSRWGSCSSSGNLNFNWRLVHAEPEIIDYVIVHELAHRVHMNHSRNFWALVAQYDPDHRTHRGWLKRHGHGLF